MRAGETAKAKPGSWPVAAGQLNAPARAKRRSRARLEEDRARSANIAIASSLFLLLLAGALLVGGHAVIDPLLRSAVAARQARGVGDVVLTMPDGIFCRHMSFDNVTAEITEGGIERCPNGNAKRRTDEAPAFAWGAH